jgi:hypothetical protein
MSSLQETFHQMETPPTKRELTNNNSSKEVLSLNIYVAFRRNFIIFQFNIFSSFLTGK